MSDRPICVLGGGNGAQCMAADLTLAGRRVNLCEDVRFASRMSRVFEEQSIELSGIGRNGRAELNLVTTEVAEAVDGVNLVNVVVPAYAHEAFFAELVPELENGQTVIVWSGGLGSLRLLHLLNERRPDVRVAICETHTLPYGARLSEPGQVDLLLSAPEILVSALPATVTSSLLPPLRELFPTFVGASSVVEAALNNPNPIVHPAGSLLNTGAIEQANGDFHLYREGITRAVARVIRNVYDEVSGVAAALGVDMLEYEERDFQSTASVMGVAFQAPFDTVGVIADVEGPHGISDRYLMEDLPFGLVPIAQLAERCSVSIPLIRSLIELGSRVCDRDFWRTGRQLEDLGVGDRAPADIMELVGSGAVESLA